jgi:hypothetical protein
MSMRLRFPALMLVSLLGPLGLGSAGWGCRARSRPAAPATLGGVGFVLPVGAPVTRGALLTMPPGREESFLAFVASGAGKWVDACRGESGDASPRFSLQTDAQGVLGAAPAESGATARDRCIAARAVAAPGNGLPPATQVTVQLALP